MPLQGEYEPSPQKWVRDQVEQYEASGGREANTLRDTGLPVVIFTTRGAKSGKVRKQPLMRVEHDGVYAMVGSQGAHPPTRPGWATSGRTRPGDGPGRAGALGRRRPGDHRRGEGAWWERAVAAYPPYAEYQRKTDREIPVFLVERREVPPGEQPPPALARLTCQRGGRWPPGRIEGADACSWRPARGGRGRWTSRPRRRSGTARCSACTSRSGRHDPPRRAPRRRPGGRRGRRPGRFLALQRRWHAVDPLAAAGYLRTSVVNGARSVLRRRVWRGGTCGWPSPTRAGSGPGAAARRGAPAGGRGAADPAPAAARGARPAVLVGAERERDRRDPRDRPRHGEVERLPRPVGSPEAPGGPS